VVFASALRFDGLKVDVEVQRRGSNWHVLLQDDGGPIVEEVIPTQVSEINIF
jgi:hypothetical protein